MEYRLSKQELHNDLLYDALFALQKSLASLDISLYVVGATARDIIMHIFHEDEPKRRTRDLDVAIAIPNWEMYDRVREVLLGNRFKKLPAKQRFVYIGINDNNDYEVDIVPFGGVEENELIKWRPEGVPVMSVKCFKDVLSHAIRIRINNSFDVNIAPLCGQFLIKFDAWIDRHDRESKDASDMLFLLGKYYEVMILSSVPPDEVDFENDPTSDFLISGAQWIAYDLKSMLTSEHLQYYINVINQELFDDSESKLIGQFVHYINDESEDVVDIVKKIWRNIQNIFQQELDRRNDEDREV